MSDHFQLVHARGEIAALQREIAAYKADALRWRRLRAMVSGQRDPQGRQFFGMPTVLSLPPVGDIMRGSVAEHLDEAIDAAIAASQPAEGKR